MIVARDYARTSSRTSRCLQLVRDRARHGVVVGKTEKLIVGFFSFLFIYLFFFEHVDGPLVNLPAL